VVFKFAALNEKATPVLGGSWYAQKLHPRGRSWVGWWWSGELLARGYL